MKNFIFKVYTFLYIRAIVLCEFIRGIDFTSIENPQELGIDTNSFYRGSGSGDAYLKRAISEIQVNNEDSILDIGSAKGSALRIFADFPFKVKAGIEISEKLASISKNNFEKLGLKIVIFNMDARDFSSYADFNTFYFYNPCPIYILEVIVNRIVDQHKRSGKLIKIIFNNPPPEDLCPLIKVGFKKIKVFPDKWGNGIAYFELQPL